MFKKENKMKIINYTSVTPTRYNNEQAKEIVGRVVIGKNDGAQNFCMRIFEMGPGGNTPKHAHPWEHEVFIHAGVGEVYGNGKWNPISSGHVLFIPPDEEHQLRNTGKELFVFACVIPAGPPEL